MSSSAAVGNLRERRRVNPWRIVLALTFAAGGVALLWQQAAVRDLEARLSALWFGFVLKGPVHSFHDSLIFMWPHGPAVRLQITAQCTIALFIGPLVLIAAAMVAFAHARMSRLSLGLLLAVAVVSLVNQLRLLVIAVAVQRWGVSGYDLSHKLIGTVISLAGFAAGALLLIRTATSQPQPRTGRHALP